MPSSVLAKRKRDDDARVLSCKKSGTPSSLRAVRQVAGLMPDSGHPSSLLGLPSAPSIVQAPALIIATIAAPPPPPVVSIQEIFAFPAAQVSALASLAGLIMASSSTVAVPLLSAGVATTS